MKIEMGESLVYSWLRHTKQCQIVQTNWKVSPQWAFHHENELDVLMKRASALYEEKYHYHIFKNTKRLSQLIRQGECDAIGIHIGDNGTSVYAVDIAFHEGGLNYGTKNETVMKIVAKSLRTAFCLYGFMDTKVGEIVFASPKVNPAVLIPLQPCIEEANTLLKESGFDFTVSLLANDTFNQEILQPVLALSSEVADTSELFLRSYQMWNMFDKSIQLDYAAAQGDNDEVKVGQLANITLRKMLEDGAATESEVQKFLTLEGSRQVFNLSYPLLVISRDKDSKRYYSVPLKIHGGIYYLCSQWIQGQHRIPLSQWIDRHK